MFNLVDKFMQNLNTEQVDNFAKSKNVFLSSEELSFTYTFVKKNYKEILKNPNLFDIDRYQSKYSEENFKKIKKVYIEYLSKYKHLF